MRKSFSVVFIFIAVLFIACNPPPDLNRNEYWEENKFPISENIEKSGAYLALEWNGRKPYIMASGNLVNREKGILRTAKHFTDAFGELGVDYCKVFLMNGKVYKAILVRVPAIRDAALIRLVPPFDIDELPELLPVASEMPQIGETVYIQGFHPHAYGLRESNKEDGFPDKVISIFEPYYGQIIKDLIKESQVVFDNLEGKVVKPDPEAIRNNPLLSDEDKKGALEYENDRYIKVMTVRDHKFSFGGLSGGVALNDKGEAFGVITAQDIFRFEFDENGFFFFPGGGFSVEITDQFYDTIYITPLDSIGDLEEYINSIR